MRSRRILLVGGLMLLLGPATALTQFGQQGGGRDNRGGGGGFPGGGSGGGFQGGGRGFGGGGGMMNQDPAERWNQMAGGKDVWVRTEVTDPNQQRIFDFMARSLNIINGQITRQQYMDWAEQMRQRFQQMGARGGMGGGRGGMGGPGGPGGAPQGGPGSPQGGAGGFNPDAMVEVMFRRYDRNGDGVLNYDEMPENLKAERDKWDTNKDGLIDLAEFKEYMKGRMDQIRAEMGTAAGAAPSASGAAGALPTVPVIPEEEPKQNVVYRAGKLPKELPAWFTQYDKDGDGQIGLYEWKATGQPLETFLKMDRNGDGFLTVEEVLRYEADQKKARGENGALASNTPGGAPAGFNGAPGGFRGPGGNFSGPQQGGNFGGPQGNPAAGNGRGDFRQRGQGRQGGGGGGQDGAGRRGARQGGG